MNTEVNAMLKNQQAADNRAAGRVYRGLKYLGHRPGAIRERQRDAHHQPAPRVGEHVLPVHAGSSRRSRLRPGRRASNRLPGRRRRLQPAHRLGPHGQHDRYGRLLSVDREEAGSTCSTARSRPFERETRTLKIRQTDGTLREERLEIRRSVHGPVVFDENGVTVAMRVAGLDRPKMLEQWFRMGEARTLEEFQSALRMMSVPMWHANYADDKRHIMFVFDGLVPKTPPARLSILVAGGAGRHIGDAMDRLPVVRRAAEIDRSVERVAPECQRAALVDDVASARSLEVSAHTSRLAARRCRRCGRFARCG